MSSLTKEDNVVKIKEIQQLLLASLLKPGENPLPKWASFERSQINRVAVVLLKYVSAKIFSDNEDCMSNLSQMFDVVGKNIYVLRGGDMPLPGHAGCHSRGMPP
jgi:hypothetical protein